MGADRTETERAIMEATYLALAERGYADLTIQSIADRFSKSKSLLYYHYETKEAIVADFLEFLLDRYREEVTVPAAASAPEQLEALLDRILPREFDDSDRDFRVSLVALQVRAAHDDRFRGRFAAIEEAVRESVRDIVAGGVENGTFTDVDPDRQADLLLAVASGGAFRAATTDPEAAREAREAIDDHVERALL